MYHKSEHFFEPRIENRLVVEKLAARPISRRCAWALCLAPRVWAAAPARPMGNFLGTAPEAPRRRFAVASGRLEVCFSQGDLTQWAPPACAVGASAIVNAANEQCLGGGGVDGAVHRCAGKRLRLACEALPVVPGTDIRCATGCAVITRAFGALQTTHVIHAVGPNVSGRSDVGDARTDPSLLGEAYKNSLHLAATAGCGAVAFPAISCGVFGYNLDAAAAVALGSVIESVGPGSVDYVEFVLYSRHTFDTFVNAAEQDARCVAILGEGGDDAPAPGSAMRKLVEVHSDAPAGEMYTQWPTWFCPGVPDPRATFPETAWWLSRPGAAQERCFVTQGRATLLFDGEELVIQKGDFVVFHRGFACDWRVDEDIEKHFAYFTRSGRPWAPVARGTD